MEKITKIYVVMLSLFSCVYLFSCKPTDKTGEGMQLVLRLSPGENNPRNSEGSFISLKDGRILFVYSHFTGSSSSDFGQGFLAGRYSYDGGKTWDSESTVIVRQEGLQNVMSVSLLRLKNGNIALFYLLKNSDSDCIPMMRISKDETKTWSDPVACISDKDGYFVLNNDRVVQFENDNRIIMPVSLHKTPSDSVFYKRGRIYTYYSDDNGQTWKTSVEVPNPNNILIQEPGIIELKDGQLMMFLRTDKGVQYVSYSSDKGQTWSVVEPGNIVSPRSSASIKRIPSTGDLLMVWNNNGVNQKRTPLNIAISKDEGKTWELIKTIENDPDGWFCYTAIHFSGEDFLLAYCAGIKSQGTSLSVIDVKKINTKYLYCK